MSRIIRSLALFSLTLGLSGYAQAASFSFDFTGECDDCAFLGDPNDIGFNPIGDGLTETVTGRLTLVDVAVTGGMIDYLGAGFVSFEYHGSSLINPFVMGSPYLFTDGLLTDGSVANGFEFSYASTQNLADPSNPVSFDFPNFCTALGEQVLNRGFGSCGSVGDITFSLASNGDWSISADAPSDIGGNGQLTAAVVPVPGALALFLSGLLGMVGLVRNRTRS